MRRLLLGSILLFVANASASNNPFEQFEGCYKVKSKRCWFEKRDLTCLYTNVWLLKKIEPNDVVLFFPMKNKAGFNFKFWPSGI